MPCKRWTSPLARHDGYRCRSVFFAVVLALLGGVGSGWVGVRYYTTKALLDDFRRMGGNPYHHQGGSDWLRRSIGDNGMFGFDEIVSIDMTGTALTDADLARVQGLASREWLHLRGTQVTDDGLAHLAGLTSLLHLDLSRTQITDKGLKHLSGLKPLANP